MNARELAEDATSRYLESLDPFSSHAQNVTNHLRGIVITLTRKIIYDDASLSFEELMPNGTSTPGSDTILSLSEIAPASRNPVLAHCDFNKDENKDDSNLEGFTQRTIARMEAFLKGCALALPDDPLPSSANSIPHSHSFPVADGSSENIMSSGLEGFSNQEGKNENKTPDSEGRGKTLLRKFSNPPPRRKKRYPQFHHDDILIRLELYCRTLRRVRESGRECVVDLEPPRATKARADSILRSFVATAGCVRSIRPILTNLIQCLTAELLAVEVLGEEVQVSINRLVSEYEAMTSFASLAFLSTPEKSAGTHLSPMLKTYLEYLQSDHNLLISGCELEGMLSHALDPELRRTFKTIEFRSIGHILEVCKRCSSQLENITLPPLPGIHALMSKCTDSKAIRQALRDLRREIITVNGKVLPPANSLKELVRLLTETLSSRATPLNYGTEGKNTKSLDDTSFLPISLADEVVILSDSFSESDADSSASSGHEGDCEDNDSMRDKKKKQKKQDRCAQGSKLARSRIKRSTSFDVGTIDKVTCRLLLAAGRTGTGGDAFFVVRDLFGGDGVMVVPSKSQPMYATSRTTKAGPKMKPAAAGTIELTVRLASVTIRCHGRYDVFPEGAVDFLEPLIQIHAVTTETISLQAVRVRDVSKNAKIEDDDGLEASMLMLREKMTSSTGKRMLSVRPAQYEKVAVWNTPS